MADGVQIAMSEPKISDLVEMVSEKNESASYPLCNERDIENTLQIYKKSPSKKPLTSFFEMILKKQQP